MNKIGVYGGSFNPIHNGHIAIAEHALAALSLNEVWFVVSPQNPFKVTSTELLGNGERLELVRKALVGHPHLLASDYEFHLPRPSYTWRTLQSIQENYPSCEFTLLIGADNWVSFNRWQNHDDIIKHFQIAIYPRRNSPVDESTLPPTVHFLSNALYNDSGTDIRRRLKNGLPIDGRVPDSIKGDVERMYR